MHTIATQSFSDGRLEVQINQPNSKVNTISTQVLYEFSLLLDEIAENREIRAVVFRSAKPNCFIAGADINELRTLTDPKLAEAFVTDGQHLFNRIAELQIPTLSVIDGVCLGGGLEFALANSYRVVSDNKKCLLGLPEVGLGLIPGWGGTQRLPRLVGSRIALEMICNGRPVSGAHAMAIGLATACVVPEDLDKTVDAILATKTTNQNQGMSTSGPVISSKEKLNVKQAIKRSRMHSQAPLAALQVVEQSARMSISEGLHIERDTFTALIQSDAGRNLTRMFFTNDRLRKECWGVETIPLSIKQPAVVGAGTMGGGIAWAFSSLDLPVVMNDINEDQLVQGMNATRSMYDYDLRRGHTTNDQINKNMDRINAVTDLPSLTGTDIVIEAVSEDLELKQQVLHALEKHVSADTIIATNSSSLPIDELSAVLTRPERFIAIHFFNPVNRMPLVEIARAPKTTDQVLSTALSLARTLGKTPIVVGGKPGFVSNRVLFPYLLEALHLTDRIEDLDELDRLARQFGLPMGPYRLIDEIGIDVTVKIASALEKSFGDRYRCPDIALDLVKAGMLGRKSGAGFYSYIPGRSVILNPTAMALRPTVNRSKASQTEFHICLALMANEASRCLEEGIVDEPMSIDMTMILGMGFPKHRGGILAHADDYGPSRIFHMLNDLQAKYGDRFMPAERIRQVAESGTRFYADHPDSAH